MQSIFSTEYSSMDELLPPYTLDNMQPPEYAFPDLTRISQELDTLITGIPSCRLDSCANIFRLTSTARRHRLKLTQQSWVREVVKQVFYHQWSPGAGILSLPAAIAHDIVKTPYHLTRMAISLSRSKYERCKADIMITNEIIDNLSLYLPAVLEIVVRLGIETCKSVEQEIQDRGYYLYLTLARLLEAYGSRFAPPGTVYLASQTILLKEHCSSISRLHFNQIHDLKENLMFLDLSPGYDFGNGSTAIERLFRTILPPLKNSVVYGNGGHCLADLLLKLRHIQEELKGLLQIKSS